MDGAVCMTGSNSAPADSNGHHLVGEAAEKSAEEELLASAVKLDKLIQDLEGMETSASQGMLLPLPGDKVSVDWGSGANSLIALCHHAAGPSVKDPWPAPSLISPTLFLCSLRVATLPLSLCVQCLVYCTCGFSCFCAV